MLFCISKNKMAAFSVAIFLFSMISVDAGAQSQPRVFEKYHLNKTFKNFSDTVILDFKYKNTTKDTIFLIRSKPTCGCIAPEIKKLTIAPGASGDFTILYFPRNEQTFNNGFIHLEFDFGMQVLSFSAIQKNE